MKEIYKTGLGESVIIDVGKRLGLYKSNYIEDWYVGYSPRNDNEYDEGTWTEWVAFAKEILRIEEEKQGSEKQK